MPRIELDNLSKSLSFSSDLSVSTATSTETTEATESALAHVAKLKKIDWPV